MENQKEFLEAIKQVVLSFDKKAEVILYGSRARGDYREDSDWDVLVLTSRKLGAEAERAMSDKLYEVELKYLQAVAAFIEDKETWAYWDIRPLNKNVAREGIIL